MIARSGGFRAEAVMASGSPPADTGRLITPAFLALVASELAYFTAYGVMIPVLPVFASNALMVGPAAVGLVIGALEVTALLLRPAAGRASDNRGPRLLMVVGASLAALAVLAHVLVSGYWELFGLRVLLGVADAMYFVAGFVVLDRITPAHRRGEALSYYSLGLYLGIAWGPALGEALLSVGGYELCWLAAGALCAGSALFATRLPLMPGLGRSEGGRLIVRGLVGPGLAFLVGLAGAAGFLAFVALRAREIGLGGAGAALFVYGATVVVVRVVCAKLTDRVPAMLLSAAALLACGSGLAALSAAPNLAGLLAAAFLLAAGVSFLTPAFYRVLMSRADERRRGAAAATFSVLVDLGIGLGPITLGLAARLVGLQTAFALSAGLVLATGVIGLALYGHHEAAKRTAG